MFERKFLPLRQEWWDGGGSSSGQVETETRIVQTPTGRFAYVYDKATGQLLEIQPLTDYVRPLEESTIRVGRGEYDDDDLAALYDAGRITDTQLRNLLEGSSGGGSGGGSGAAYAQIAEQRRQFDQEFAEDKRQFDITTQEGRRQFDLDYARTIAADAAQMGYNYDQLNQQEKDAVRNLAYQYYNSTNDANAARQQALSTLLQAKQNGAIDVAQTSGNIAAQAAQFASNPRDAVSDLLYRNAVGGISPYGSTDNAQFGQLQTGLANRFQEMFGGVGRDLQYARDAVRQPIPQEYLTPIRAPQVDLTPTQYTAPQVHPFASVDAAYKQNRPAAEMFFAEAAKNPEGVARMFGPAVQQKADADAAAVRSLASQNYSASDAQKLMDYAKWAAANGVPGFARGGSVQTIDPNEKIRRAREGLPTGQEFGESTATRGIRPTGQVAIGGTQDGAPQLIANPVDLGPGNWINRVDTPGGPGRWEPLSDAELQQRSADAFKARIDAQMANIGIGSDATPAQRSLIENQTRTLLEANAAGAFQGQLSGLSGLGLGSLARGMQSYDPVAAQARIDAMYLNDINRNRAAVGQPPVSTIANFQSGGGGAPTAPALGGNTGMQFSGDGSLIGATGSPTGGLRQPAVGGNTPQTSFDGSLDASADQVNFTPVRYAQGGSVTAGQLDLSSIFDSRAQPGFSPPSSEGGTNMNIHERAVIVGESGQVYGTLGEKRPDGSIRAEQLIIKPLPSEVKKDKEMEAQDKQAIESQKKTLKAFAQGGTVTGGVDLLGQIRARLRGLDPQVVAGPGQLLADPRLLANIYPQLGPTDKAYVQSGYSSQGISPEELDFTVNRFRPQGLGYAPQVRFQ